MSDGYIKHDYKAGVKAERERIRAEVVRLKSLHESITCAESKLAELILKYIDSEESA